DESAGMSGQGEGFAVRREGQRGRQFLSDIEPALLFSRARIPKAQPVAARRDQHLAVWGQSQKVQAVLSINNLTHLLAAGNVPYSDRVFRMIGRARFTDLFFGHP